MPDTDLILKALAAAAGVAIVITAAAATLVLLISGRPWRPSNTPWVASSAVLAVAAGFYIGCWILGLWPRWPPAEDKDRFLALVFPAIIAVELFAAFPRVPRLLVWALRLIVVGTTGRVLLHGSTYLTDLTGPNTREWSPVQTWLILGGLAAVLAVVWTLLALLERRGPAWTLPVIMAGICFAAAGTIMLSGYSSGGQLGLPLGAALIGIAVAAPFLPHLTSWLGLAVVGLSGFLVMGHFFGQLTASHALLLFGAPLLAWIPILLPFHWMRPWLRGLAQVILVAAVAAFVMAQAKKQFDDNSKTHPSSPGEPSIDDYLNFGK
jgi:hypothetical protein